jgi:hypothetical protein
VPFSSKFKVLGRALEDYITSSCIEMTTCRSLHPIWESTSNLFARDWIEHREKIRQAMKGLVIIEL